MKKCLAVLLAVAFIAGVASAQIGPQRETDNRGMSGFAFLKMPVSARSVALCESSYSNDMNASAIFANISELSDINSASLFYSNQRVWDNLITLNSFAVGVKVSERIAIGAFVRALSTDPIGITTLESPEGTGIDYEVTDTEMGVAFSARVTKRFSIGLKVKGVSEKIAQTSASTVLFDVATLYRITFSNIRISTVFENYGPDARYDGNDLWWKGDLTTGTTDLPSQTDPNRSANLTTKEFSAPTSITVAVKADIIGENTMVPVEGNVLSLHTAMIKSNDSFENGSFGLEYMYTGLKSFEFALRGGMQMYREKDWDTTYAFGGGIKYAASEDYSFGIDYAYRSHDQLDQSHFFSINVNF